MELQVTAEQIRAGSFDETQTGLAQSVSEQISLEFEIATLANDGSGFSGDKALSAPLAQVVSSRRT